MSEPSTHDSPVPVGGPPPKKPSGGKSARVSDGWIIGGMLFASIAIIGVIMGWAFNGSSGGGAITAGATPSTKTVDVTLGEFYIKPASINVAPGTSLVFNVKNVGTMQHDFKVNSTATPMLNPGGTATLKTDPINATVTGFCTVPGHEAAGMKMTINVTSGGASQNASAGMTNMNTAATGSGVDPKDAKIDPAALPAKGFKASDPSIPPMPTGTVHDLTFIAEDKLMEVAPGVKQMMWTFNGTVPGPILRGHVGDTFNVKLINKGSMGHSLDFHASQTNMDEDMRTIQPGQSLTYSFVAQHSGIWMYHCGTPPVIHHIANGMYGAVIIDPPNLPPVTHEYVILQSELYLGQSGQPADLAKAMAGTPDAVVFNGYYNQYVYDPIKVKAGDRLRFWVLDIGPNDILSFHIIGTQFDTVFKEGAYLLQPNNPAESASQVLGLMPAEGGFVELTVPKKGMYAIANHKFNDASMGALGHIIAQ